MTTPASPADPATDAQMRFLEALCVGSELLRGRIFSHCKLSEETIEQVNAMVVAGRLMLEEDFDLARYKRLDQATLWSHVELLQKVKKELGYLWVTKAPKHMLHAADRSLRESIEDAIIEEISPPPPAPPTHDHEAPRPWGALIEEADKPPVGEGMYSLLDKIYRVRKARNSPHLYAEEMIQSGTTVAFKYAKGVIYKLRPEHRIDAGRKPS